MPTAVALAAAVLSLLALTAPVVGHEGGPRLILDPVQVNPGGVVLVRGEDLALDETMDVSLVGDTGRADLGQVTTDGEGHFVLSAAMPVDAPVGHYAIEAVNTTGNAVRSVVVLQGSPIFEQGGAPPGQDEGLPGPGQIPVATAGPVVAPAATAGVPATSSGSTLRPMQDPATAFDPVPFVALAGAIGALAFLFWRTRRSPGAQTPSTDLS